MTTSHDHAPRLVDLGNGHRIAVEIKGRGPTVVLESAGAGHGIGYWGEFDRLLAQHATVVTYDRLGCGHSEPMLAHYPTPTQHARTLAALLDLLPVQQPVVLVGWSMGGLMAQQFAALYPQKVAALLLLDPTTFGGVDAQPGVPAWLRWVIARISAHSMRRIAAKARNGAYRRGRARARFREQMQQTFGPQMPAALAEQTIERLATRAELSEATAKLLSRLPQISAEVSRTIAERGLPRIPLLLLLSSYLGKKPGTTATRISAARRRAYAAEAARLGGELRNLENISHQIPCEAPEQCVRAVRELLAQIPQRVGAACA